MIRNILWPNATRAFFLPSRLTALRYVSERIVPLVWLADQATCTSIDLSQALPLVVLPVRRLPALWLFPGHIPAQLARCPAVANFAMSGPISATITSADRAATPGIVASRAAASRKGGGRSFAAAASITSAIRA